MKKIANISQKLQNNNFSYTGKGGFEAIVNKHKKDILQWLEELIPLQQQLEFLYEKENVEFQKRNYIRILTKYFPKEYKEFVNINILLRDSKAIKQSYLQQQDVTNLYNILVTNNYLKYPGRNENFVDFDIFEEFIKVYKDELQIDYISNENLKSQQISKTKNTPTPQQEEEQLIRSEEDTKKDKEENYWTNLLLGKR